MKTKQVAALLMDNCKTIMVEFQGTSDKMFTYKTIDNHEIGDLVVVPVRGCEVGNYRLKVATVVQVHKGVNIDLDSDRDYHWVVQGVDMAQFSSLNLLEKSFHNNLQELEQTAVRANAKAMLTEQLGLDTDKMNEAVKLLNAGVEGGA